MQGTLAEYVLGMNLKAQIQVCRCVRHLLGPISGPLVSPAAYVAGVNLILASAGRT